MAIDDVPCCEAYEVHEDKIRAANEQMPDEDELYDLAELFKVFGDSTRIRILFVLLDRKSTRLNSSHNNQSRMPSSA